VGRHILRHDNNTYYCFAQEPLVHCNSSAVCGVADHRIANIDLTLFAGSALTSAIEVPKDRDMDVEDAIP
jgi:hypothetical protein